MWKGNWGREGGVMDLQRFAHEGPQLGSGAGPHKLLGTEARASRAGVQQRPAAPPCNLESC